MGSAGVSEGERTVQFTFDDLKAWMEFTLRALEVLARVKWLGRAQRKALNELIPEIQAQFNDQKARVDGGVP